MQVVKFERGGGQWNVRDFIFSWYVLDEITISSGCVNLLKIVSSRYVYENVTYDNMYATLHYQKGGKNTHKTKFNALLVITTLSKTLFKFRKMQLKCT